MKMLVFSVFALLLTGSSAVAQIIKSDDFNQFNLDRSIWTFTDPVHDATLTLPGTNTPDARLSLSVPGGIAHDIWTAGNLAPRITQPAPDSDFTIRAKFESPESLAFQIQGMLVEATATNFLRFDFYSDGTNTKMFAANVNGGGATIYGNIVIGANTIQPLYMKISRSGDQWKQYFSSDGITWTDSTVFTHPLIVTTVGLYAATADPGFHSAPGQTALVDFFQNDALPIMNEDGNTAVVDTLKPFTYDISSIAAETSFMVDWRTDEAATGRVEYGFTTSYELGSISQGILSTDHSLPVFDLLADTTYHYRIISSDNGGLTDTTMDRTIRTTNPFVVSGVRVYPTSGSVTISWTTMLNANSKVFYGPTTVYGDSLIDTTSGTSHLLNVTGLHPFTLYHFKAASVDSASNMLSYHDSTFTTAGLTTLVSDEFNSGTLNTTLWQFINKSGDGTQAMTGDDVTLGVPGGSRHDVWDDLNNAPRIKQNCNNADFQVNLKFDAAMNQGYQIEGLIVQQDSANFLRLDFNSNGTAISMFAASFINNVVSTQLNQLGVDTLNGAPLYMRVTRQGGIWKQEYSLNGASWTTGITFLHVMNVSSVALFAGNAGTNPGFVTSIDYFRLPNPPSITANIKVLLEGPYDPASDSMTTEIRDIVPLTQPYGIAPWNYPGTETVTGVPSRVTDWVLLELRTGTGAASKAATRAAFIRSDGTIVDTSGTGAVTFVNIPVGNYYVVVHHRNHLAVMSANAVALDGASSLYDFTVASSRAYGTGPMKQLSTNIWGLFGGDSETSGTIDITDLHRLLDALNQTGYNNKDINLSGIVSAADANIVIQNFNTSSQVP